MPVRPPAPVVVGPLPPAPVGSMTTGVPHVPLLHAAWPGHLVLLWHASMQAPARQTWPAAHVIDWLPVSTQRRSAALV